MNYKFQNVLQGTSEGGWMLMVRGLPGSGKSTKSKELAKQNGIIHIEADMYFTRNGEYEFDQEKMHRAFNWCLDTTNILLAQKRTVVVSNCFLARKNAMKYVDMCKKFGHALSVCTMDNNFGSVHNVPEETILGMKNSFQSHEDFIYAIQDI